MRLLASGDNHWRKGLRFAECRAVHAFMVEQARELQVDVFVDGGDVFDEESDPEEREAVADWMAAVTDHCPMVIAKGNHDRPRDVAFFRRLQTKHPIIVEEGAGVHYVAGAAIATMAWPERAHLLAALGSSGAADAGMREALQAVLRGLGQQLEQHDGPRILLGHFMVDGSLTSTGQPLLGMPINVGLSDLSLARAHLTVMGHIHMAQRFELETGPAFYTGSPFRTDFGQLEKKTILFAEFDGQRLVETREIETPCAPMVHVSTEYDAEDAADRLDALEGLAVQGAEVRLRYAVAADARDAGRLYGNAAADILRAQGAVSVKVEEQVIATKRARAPEVALAKDIGAKLDAHWHSTGFDPTAEHREALINRAREIEMEVANAS